MEDSVFLFQSANSTTLKCGARDDALPLSAVFISWIVQMLLARSCEAKIWLFSAFFAVWSLTAAQPHAYAVFAVDEMNVAPRWKRALRPTLEARWKTAGFCALKQALHHFCSWKSKAIYDSSTTVFYVLEQANYKRSIKSQLVIKIENLSWPF